MSHQPRERKREDVKHVYWPVGQDRVPSNEVYACVECGHEFRDPPFNDDVCPECGADFWPLED